MNRPSLLVIVRHAESMRNWVKKGSVYFPDEDSRSLVKGVPDQDIPITDLGKDQAMQTGVALRKVYGTFDYVYHSGTSEQSRLSMMSWRHILPRNEHGYVSARICSSESAILAIPTK